MEEERRLEDIVSMREMDQTEASTCEMSDPCAGRVFAELITEESLMLNTSCKSHSFFLHLFGL